MQYNFYGTDLYVNARRGVFLKPSRTYTMEHLCENHKKSFIVDVRLGSKYASAISSTVEKVYRISIFV